MSQMKTEFDRSVYTSQTALRQNQRQIQEQNKLGENQLSKAINSEPNSTLYVFSPSSSKNVKSSNVSNVSDVSNAPKTSKNISDNSKTLNTLNNSNKSYIQNVQKNRPPQVQPAQPKQSQPQVKQPQSQPPKAQKESGSVAVIQMPVKPQAVVVSRQDEKNTGAGKKNNAKIIPTVKRLADRFKKSGLGVIDSYFNACFFYCQYHKSKKETIKPESEAQSKGRYGAYIVFLTFIAKLWGFILDIISPVRSLAKLIAKTVKTPKNISVKSAVKELLGLAVPAAAVIFTVTMIVNISAYKPRLELCFNGQTVGFVDSKETVTKVVSLIENNVGSVLNEQYEFTGNISYRIVLSKNPDSDYVSESELYYLMYSPEAQGEVTRAYGLYIDNEFLGANESESEINRILTEVLQANSDGGSETVEYANDIKIIPDNYAKRDVVTQDELKNIISNSAENTNASTANTPDTNTNEGKSKVEIADAEIPLAGGRYISADTHADSQADGAQNPQNAVMSDGTGEDIAVAAAMSSNLAPETINTIPRGFLNPPAESGDSGQNPDNQQSQDSQNELLARLTKTTNKISANSILFKKIKTESYCTVTPFETKYIESNKYYTGTQTVQTNGSNGESLITAEVTYIGNEEVSREIIETKVTKEPVDKVIIIGTKVKPTTTPTGKFIRPVKGGYTTTRFRQGGHRGVDLVVPYGTSIYAADGGTVEFAGWGGSYGNYVKIKHGNGFETIYAHASSLLVEAGDKVYQGQEIAKVGSTGNSTGNHLHFEISKNGALVNPESYFNNN